MKIEIEITANMIKRAAQELVEQNLADCINLQEDHAASIIKDIFQAAFSESQYVLMSFDNAANDSLSIRMSEA